MSEYYGLLDVPLERPLRTQLRAALVRVVSIGGAPVALIGEAEGLRIGSFGLALGADGLDCLDLDVIKRTLPLRVRRGSRVAECDTLLGTAYRCCGLLAY